MIHSPRASLARPVLLLALVFSMAACGAKDDADDSAAAGSDAPVTSTQSVDEQLDELSEYKLSMDKIDRYIAVQRNIAERAAAMSPAEREAMKEKYGNNDNANASLDDMTRTVAENPIMSAAVRKAGLSPREYTMLTMSMMQTAMAASVLKMRPNDNQDSLAREMKVNTDNIRFYQEHEAEIARKTTELQAEMKRLGMDEG